MAGPATPCKPFRRNALAAQNVASSLSRILTERLRIVQVRRPKHEPTTIHLGSNCRRIEKETEP
jgi:hypothetical protein